MFPLSDGLSTRRFPIVNVALIVANFAVWLFYELPHLNSAVFHASFYPCTVDSSCNGPEPWGVSWITAMFMHGSWDHILGNMLFLAIFGKNVEDAFGPLRYLAFYFAGGFAATMTQTAMTLLFGTARDGQVPNLGASGAIAAVLGRTVLIRTRASWPDRGLARAYLGLVLPRLGSSTSCSRRTSSLAHRQRRRRGLLRIRHASLRRTVTACC